MKIERWNSLWNEVFFSFYRSYFEELCADFLLRRLKLIDFISKVLLGITASGSTIAGYALWDEPGYKTIWSAIAGVAALISVIHVSFSVTEKINSECIVLVEYRNLRQELEMLQTKMRIVRYPKFETYLDTYTEILERYTKIRNPNRPNLLLTKKKEESIQEELNRRLGYE